MRRYLFHLADHIWRAATRSRGEGSQRFVEGHSPGGDAQFDIDKVAEGAVREFVRHAGIPVAVYTEGAGLTQYGRNPSHLLVIDPIDGTRPAAAGLDAAMISIAAAPMSADPRISDVDHALLREIGTGAQLYWDAGMQTVRADGYRHSVPAPSRITDLDRMFWSVEFNGHPCALMISAYGHLIDASANTGGLFVFNSASFSISRILTGQLDAYVDIGNRLLRDHPEMEADFRRVGHGNVLHLFPHDIAAAVTLAERAGIVITDGYAQPLGKTRLLEVHPLNQQSCVAASNPVLHAKLFEAMRL